MFGINALLGLGGADHLPGAIAVPAAAAPEEIVADAHRSIGLVLDALIAVVFTLIALQGNEN